MSEQKVPSIAIVIPIYNEEGILHSAVVDLRERLKPLNWNYEIILAENGSTDRTVALANELSQKYPEVRAVSAGAPDYGKALREGILLTQAEIVLYCGGGYRSALAADALQKMGYTQVWSMDGGFRGWKDAGHPIEQG